MSEREMSREPDPLERALAALRPAPARIDRDRLMFSAGQSAARRHRWTWPSISALAGLMAAVFGIALFVRPASLQDEPVPGPSGPVVENGTVTKRESGSTAVLIGEEEFKPAGHLMLRKVVLRAGIDALPPATEVMAPPERLPLEQLLDLPVDPHDAPSLLWPRTDPKHGESL